MKEVITQVVILLGVVAGKLEAAERECARLRKSGYKHLAATQSTLALLGRQVVVVWEPGPPDLTRALELVRQVAPESVTVVLTREHLVGVKLDDRLILTNSVWRLREVLSFLAEAMDGQELGVRI